MFLAVTLVLCIPPLCVSIRYMEEHCNKTLYMRDFGFGLDLSLTKSHKYSPNLNCSMRLVAPTHHRFAVTFRDLQLASFDSCAEDYLEILECDGQSCHESFRYCGVVPPAASFISSTNVLRLRFISNAVFHGGGFHLYVTTFHEGECEDDEVECVTGRCVHQSVRCSHEGGCADGSDSCQEASVSALEALGFLVGAIILVVVVFFVVVLIWYHVKQRHESNIRASRICQRFVYVD